MRMQSIVACMLRKALMAADKIIYLDNAATTIPFPSILETYTKAKQIYFANPSSIHIPGQEASRMLDKAREQILSALSLNNEHEVIFTSGATEANNLAIKGYALKYSNRGKHIITSVVEHPSVLETVNQLKEYFGFDVTYLPVNKDGIVDINSLKTAIRKDTILVSLMMVNNEIGAINKIEEIASLLKQYPTTIFHVDATQGIGKIRMSFKDVDMISFSGHKIHGLNSSGALIKKSKLELLPLLSGGGQERNFRSGTNDVALAVSLAKAMRLSYEKIDENYAKIQQNANILLEYVKNNPDLYELNSGNNPYIVNFSSLSRISFIN